MGLAEETATLVATLGPGLCLRISDQLEGLEEADWPARKPRVMNLPADAQRRLLLAQWLERGDPALAVRAVVLRAAALAAQQTRDIYKLELVWSGPERRTPPSRLTEQAMLEVIEGARQELLIVCYTIHRIESLRAALIAALKRGVRLTLVLEDMSKVAEMTRRALKDLARDSPGFQRYHVWPREKHPDGVMNLHVKCLVADRKQMLLGSANLTKAAMERNMELGVLITGGPEPEAVVDHFRSLIRHGVLLPRSPEAP